MPLLTSVDALLEEGVGYLLLEDGVSHLLLETIASGGQLNALRSQPAASKLYLAILAPQVNRVYVGIVTAYVRTGSFSSIATTDVSGSLNDIYPGMTLWAGTSADDYTYGRVRVKSGPGFAIVTAEQDEIPFAVGTYVSVYAEWLPWGKLPYIAPDGVIYKDADETFIASPSQQTKKWPPIAMMGSPAVGIVDHTTTLAYVYFDGVQSYATAPGASIASYAWTFYYPSGAVMTTSAVMTPGYIQYTVQGEHWAELIVTDSNGIASTSRRMILIVDPLTPDYEFFAYTAFELSRFESDVDTGWGASFKVFGTSDPTYFPNGAMVMLYSDDYYGTTHNSIYNSQLSHGNTFASAVFGTADWATPSNALARDGIYTTATLGTTASTLINNIISYWKLEEASGNRIDAVTATGNDLTPNGAPSNGTGKIGNGAVFVAASTQSVSRADNASLSMGAGKRKTFAAWVKQTNTANSHAVIGKWGGGTNEYVIALNDLGAGSYAFYANDGATKIASAVAGVTANVWHLLIAWYDGTNLNISLDNAAAVTAACGDIVDSTNTFYIGAFAANQYLFEGTIDEAGVWDRVLTAGERTELYNSGSGKTYNFAIDDLLTYYLKATNFGFTLPTTAKILGIASSIVMHVSVALNDVGPTVRLIVGGSIVGTDMATGLDVYGTSDATYPYGGSTSLWGVTPTVAQVNASDFGVSYAFLRAFYPVIVSVDYIDMTVYYLDDTGIGFETHRTNVKYVGYLLDDSVSVNPQASTVEFDSGCIARVLERQYMRPTFTQDVLVPTTWSESYALTMRRATLYYIYWHTTIHEIADCYIESDSTPIAIADFPKQSVWEMLRNWVSAKRMMHAGVTKNGRVEIRIDVQALTLAQRNALVVVMQLLASDWQGEVNITESPLNPVSFADVSGQWYEGNPAAAPIPIFSKAPGFTPAAYGRDYALQYLALTGQLDTNALTGNVFRWRNNDYPRVTIVMAGNWVSAFDPAYQEYTRAPVVGFPSHRGAQLADARLILRQMANTFNNAGGYWTSTLTFEVESPTTPSGVIGDYPPTSIGAHMEACPLGYVWNNTSRTCALLGTTPSQFPWANTWRDTVYVATYLHGVYYTTDFGGPDDPDATWAPANDGLAGAGTYMTVAGVPYLRQMVSDPYNPTTMYLISESPDIGTSSILFRFNTESRKWEVVTNATALMNAAGLGGDCSLAFFSTLMTDAKQPAGWIGAFICNTDNPNFRTFFVYSSNYGVTWQTPVLVAGSTGINRQHKVQARGVCGSIQSTALAQTIYAPVSTDYTNNDNGTLYKSVNGGTTWAASAYTSPTYSFKLGNFYIDPSDQSVMWFCSEQGAGTGIVQFTGTATAVSAKVALGSRFKYAFDAFYNPSGHAQTLRFFPYNNTSIYKSTDEGVNFVAQAVPASPPPSAFYNGLMTLPDSSGKLIGIGWSGGAVSPQIFVSDDEGTGWVSRAGAGYANAWPGDGESIPYDVTIVDVLPIWNVI